METWFNFLNRFKRYQMKIFLITFFCVNWVFAQTKPNPLFDRLPVEPYTVDLNSSLFTIHQGLQSLCTITLEKKKQLTDIVRCRFTFGILQKQTPLKPILIMLTTAIMSFLTVQMEIYQQKEKIKC